MNSVGECFGRWHNFASLEQQNETSSKAALETAQHSRGLCSRADTACTKSCKHPEHVTQDASWRLCWDCLLSFLPREIRPDRSTPSLRCRGDPGTPKLLAASGRTHLPHPLAQPEKQSSLVAKFRPWTTASQPRTAVSSGRCRILPLSPAPSEPLPGPARTSELIAPLQAFSLRGAGVEPNSRGVVQGGGWSLGGKWRRVAPR